MLSGFGVLFIVLDMIQSRSVSCSYLTDPRSPSQVFSHGGPFLAERQLASCPVEICRILATSSGVSNLSIIQHNSVYISGQEEFMGLKLPLPPSIPGTWPSPPGVVGAALRPANRPLPHSYPVQPHGLHTVGRARDESISVSIVDRC